MFKIGDKVKFTTETPNYDAWYSDEVLKVMLVYDDGDYEVYYPLTVLSQRVHPSDVEIVND